MTAATTLKLDERLKSQVLALAKREGKTPHAWMIEAIAAQAERSAMRATFVAEALASAREVARTGETYSADKVHAYLRQRVSGKKARRPTSER